MLERRKRAIWRAAIVLALAGVAAIALREVVLSSTFQLFGDYVARVDTPERLVALTFDDGPGPYTHQILDILKRNGVHATFFLIGQQVAGGAAILKIKSVDWPGSRETVSIPVSWDCSCPIAMPSTTPSRLTRVA